jgi:hypothetical protein
VRLSAICRKTLDYARGADSAEAEDRAPPSQAKGNQEDKGIKEWERARRKRLEGGKNDGIMAQVIRECYNFLGEDMVIFSTQPLLVRFYEYSFYRQKEQVCMQYHHRSPAFQSELALKQSCFREPLSQIEVVSRCL